MGRAVYVRGVGALTPLGETWPASCAALAEGRGAIGPVTRFDASGFPCAVAATVGEGADPRASDRRLALALPAAREAWNAARIDCDPGRVGVFVGAEAGRIPFPVVIALGRAAGGGRTFDHARFGVEARSFVERMDASVTSPGSVASALAAAIGAAGPVETVSLACASGSAAIAEAARAIQLGECDAALCGGVGADVDELMFAAFGLLRALSERGISRPFDAHRDGFVLGEGAAMAVLSSERGGAQVEIAGTGKTLDAHHLTAPDPRGDGAYRAMELALREAGDEPIGYVQAHGTSTPLNDAVEAAALRRALGARLEQAHVSSVKGAVGHWIAGAGAIGFLCAVEAVLNGVLLPTVGLSHPDPECALPHVLGRAIRKDVGAALVNSLGFGGANCSIVARRCA